MPRVTDNELTFLVHREKTYIQTLQHMAHCIHRHIGPFANIRFIFLTGIEVDAKVLAEGEEWFFL